jgi:O-antigen/teichoic acid export membrane protein
MVLSINNNLILETYLFIHMLVGALAAFAVLTWTTRSVALKWRPVLPNIATCTAAWRYAAMSGAALASSELDKPLLVRVMGLLQVGHYALAYRICSAMAMPATALAAAMLPRWVDAFAKGDSISLQRSFLRVLLAVAVVGLILTALLYYWLTIYPPGSLGLYPQAWPWIHGLACLGLVLGLRQVAATSLIAVGRPLTRALLDIASLGILVTVAWLVYPALGSKAVILACIFAEICAAGAMAMIFFSALSNMKSIGSLSDV